MHLLINYYRILNRNFGLLVLFIFLVAINTNSAAISDRVVAVINNDVVTEKELETRLERIQAKPTKAEEAKFGRINTDDELRYQVLKSLVEETVLVQRAKQLGIKVSPSEVDKAATGLIQSLGVDASIESNQTLVNALRKDVESELLVSRLVGATLARNITVSDFEIDEILSTKKKSNDDKEFEVLQLFVKTAEDDAESVKQELQAKLNQWREELIGGASMDDIVKANESAEIVPVSRNLGWKTVNQLPDLFLSQLNAMKNGDTSAVITSPNALHILQLVNTRGEEIRMVEKRSVQHILISAKTDVERQQAARKLRSIRNTVMEESGDFSEFASMLSDDPRSAAKGGDLGWMKPGETVPEFNEVLFGMEVGEVSEPVETPFGVHLMKLNEIQEEDISVQAERDRVADQVRRRKTRQQYSGWLSDLMSRAYIDYF